MTVVEVIEPDDPEAVRVAAIISPQRFKAVPQADPFADLDLDPAVLDLHFPEIDPW